MVDPPPSFPRRWESADVSTDNFEAPLVINIRGSE